MSDSLEQRFGFAAPDRRARAIERRAVMVMQAIAVVALVLSIAVAAATVSIGIARADAREAFGPETSTTLAIAAFLACLFAGMGGLTAVFLRQSARERGESSVQR